MIRYQKHDALHPEKETTVAFDFSPLLVFAVGYFVARSLLGALVRSADAGRPLP
ncbi:hypothetical protein [Deinococcus irradiatisoli]|uniref:hypothetical protein n=1 Tax=Deinococcus irradiatisoli TaxID=2202254 RepID=UPI0015E843A8|nr:hypothetical protein [Deinococcus irradiatisoli]